MQHEVGKSIDTKERFRLHVGKKETIHDSTSSSFSSSATPTTTTTTRIIQQSNVSVTRKQKKCFKKPIKLNLPPRKHIPFKNDAALSMHAKKSIHESTTLSPILNQVSSFTFPSLSCFKRRKGLVRRTHSPVTIPSPPTANCITRFVSTRRGHLAMPYVNSMGSKFVPLGECSSKLLPKSEHSSDPKLKKRKRCHSPKNGKRSRSKSPLACRVDQLNGNILKQNHAEAPAAVKVKVVSPTLRGVSESARLLRNGIFSFPTETMYSLVSFIHFRRRKHDIGNEDRSLPCQWQSLLDLKQNTEKNNNQSSHFDRPLLFVHSPSYACNYVSFSKLKTFVYKHPQSNNDDANAKRKFSAVTFSESHEVLNRLSSTFWPGPVTIFAPVKKVRSRTSPLVVPNTMEKVTGRSLVSNTKSSCASLTSLTSESSDDQPPNLSLNEDEGEGSVPILPVSSLVSSQNLIGNQGHDGESYFIGMRCPSHPLARRILSEVYEVNEPKKNSSKKKAQNRVPGAIMGFSALILSNGSQPYTCKDVCTNLTSIQSQGNSPSASKSVVHVMNGEDRREMFFVPAGQYRQNSEVALVIDTPNRTVHLLRKTGEDAEKMNEAIQVQVEDVIRALHFQQKGQHSTVTTRAITSVLHQWKVNEINP